MARLRNIYALLRGLAAPTSPEAQHGRVADTIGRPPASHRLDEVPHEQDVNGEISIATAQGTVTLTELDYREAELQRLNEQLRTPTEPKQAT